jgi:hypothetical protein
LVTPVGSVDGVFYWNAFTRPGRLVRGVAAALICSQPSLGRCWPVKAWQAAVVALVVTGTTVASGVLTSTRSIVRDKVFAIAPNSIERGRVLCHTNDGLAPGAEAHKSTTRT